MRCVLSEIGRTKGTIGDMDPVKTVQKTAVPSDLLKSSFGIASTTQRKAPNSILMSAKRYGIALGIFVAATLVRMAIDPVGLHDQLHRPIVELLKIVGAGNTQNASSLDR